MKKILITKLLLVLIFAPLACFALPKTYLVKDMGTLGTDKSEAVSINENGVVLGKYEFEGLTHAFIWSEEKGIQIINEIICKQYQHLNVKKINALGQVLLEVWRTPRDLAELNAPLEIQMQNGGGYVSYIWTHSSGLKPVISKKGLIIASDINDNGVVVGEVINKSGKRTPCMWNRGITTELELLVGDNGVISENGTAMYINNNSDIVGTCMRPMVHHGRVVKTLKTVTIWEASNEWRPRDPFPVSINESMPYMISDDQYVYIFMSGVGGFFYDLLTEKTFFPKYYGSGDTIKGMTKNRICANGGLIQIKNISFGNNNDGPGNYEVVPLDQFIPKPVDRTTHWTREFKIHSVNSKAMAVGICRNIYGERHAILFTPLGRW